ncbi:unnamed protein product [Didymodactylos carnosus]|uniref:Uncharacterized protein n=2 Tax=Didymodactylos carnosus TaxID=1234261 RepID=A0A814QHU5_9BILA|nr:unnamed protein product [Didymodactylos carnosus]CAF3884365.1 unnamed protein product [Didymodactylos carnosus]
MIYDSYEFVYDYEKQVGRLTSTSIETLEHLFYQLENKFSWTEKVPNDVELSFILQVYDHFQNNESLVPTPFKFISSNTNQVYKNYPSSSILGVLKSTNGEIQFKFAPPTKEAYSEDETLMDM